MCTFFLEWFVGGRSLFVFDPCAESRIPIENPPFPPSIYTVHRETEFYRQQSWQVECVNKFITVTFDGKNEKLD